MNLQVIQNYRSSRIFSITARPRRENPVLQTTRAKQPNQNQSEALFHLVIIASPSRERPNPITTRLATEYLNEFFISKFKRRSLRRSLHSQYLPHNERLHKHLNRKTHRSHIPVDIFRHKLIVN